MKFNKYLENNKQPEWSQHYIKYGELKKLLSRVLELGAPVVVPTALSLSLVPGRDHELTPQEHFFLFLEGEVKRINDFTQKMAASLRARLREVSVAVQTSEASGLPPHPKQRERWLGQAKALGEEYLALEKYVNLNYAGLQKILKKHDKLIPSAPCWQFYRLHISRQPWVRGDHHDIQATLSRTFSQLHKALARSLSAAGAAAATSSSSSSQHERVASGAAASGPSTSAQAQAHAAAAAARSARPPAASLAPLPMGRSGAALLPLQQLKHTDEYTEKYWVQPSDVAEVVHVLMQHLSELPAPSNAAAAAAAMVAAAAYNHQDTVSRARPSAQRALAAAAAAVAAAGAAALWEDCDRQNLDVVNCLYLDNPSLELYHNLLYGRPYATTLQIRWHGSRVPEMVQVVRHVHREGWRPEACTEDRFPIQETRVAEWLTGRWTWADERKLLFPDDSSSQGRPVGYPGGGGGGARGSGGPSGVAALNIPSSMTAPPDPQRLALEYQTFKTFTEVQRLVESKGLQPVVKARFRQTVYQPTPDPDQPEAQPTLAVRLEEGVEMLLEYAYDGGTRLAHGIWRQEHPADVIEFPFAVLKIHRRTEDPLPDWLTALLSSRLVQPANDFSTFLHGCAGLLPDMVRAVPQWVDEPAIQKSLFANIMANDDLQAMQMAGHDLMSEMEDGLMEARGSGAARAGASLDLAPRASLTGATAGQSHGLVRGRGADDGGSVGSSLLQPLLTYMSSMGHAPSRSSSSRLLPARVSASGAGQLGAAAGGSGAGKPPLPSLAVTASRRQASGTAGLPSAEASATLQGGLQGLSPQRMSGECMSPGAEGYYHADGGGPEEDSTPMLPLLHSLQRDVSTRVGAALVQAGWQAKLLQRQRAAGKAYQPQLMFVDPMQFMRNERIFIMWISDAITIGGLATGMLGFAANAMTTKSEKPTIHISEVTALILMAVSISLTTYGLASYVWRSTRFYELMPTRFDDTTGTLAMTALICLSFLALMIFNIADLMEILGDS